jgi:hypothetical protein
MQKLSSQVSPPRQSSVFVHVSPSPAPPPLDEEHPSIPGGHSSSWLHCVGGAAPGSAGGGCVRTATMGISTGSCGDPVSPAGDPSSVNPTM